MRKLLFVIAVVVLASGIAAQEQPSASAQKPAQPTAGSGSSYRLDFVVRELEDAKAVNSRNYSMMLMTLPDRGRNRGELKAGTRVPIASGDKGTVYMDVGVSITAELNDTPDGLLLSAATEISSLALPEGVSQSSSGTPLVRMVRATGAGYLTFAKPILLSSVDDINTRHRFQVEVTATKLK